jgi:hypothetical protein
MFRAFFSDNLKKRCRIIHFDRCGCNLSTDLLYYFRYERKIAISVTNGTLGNQVVEGFFAILKLALEVNKNSIFKNSYFEHKQELIKEAYNKIDNNKGKSKNKCAKGYPRALTHKAKEFFWLLDPEKNNTNVFFARSYTDSGAFIGTCSTLIVKSYVLLIEQQELCNKFNLQLELMTENEILEINKLSLSINNMKEVDNKLIETGYKSKFMKLILRILNKSLFTNPVELIRHVKSC